MCYMRAVNTGEDTTLSQIVSLVERAQSGKAPVQEYADKISSIFVPIVLGISALTFAIWGTLCYHDKIPASWSVDDNYMILPAKFAIATLVIACPCALGLAAPTAVMVGTGVGAKNGILIKGGEALESASKIDTAIFDKTGTLTKGKPVVKVFEPMEGMTKQKELEKLLFLSCCAEKSSEHPLATAIAIYCVSELERYASPLIRKIYSPSEFKAVTGKGISCVVDGSKVDIGNRPFMEISGVRLGEAVERRLVDIENGGLTVIVIAVEGKLKAICGLSDELKSDSPSTIRQLHSMGIQCWMVTGDNARTARAIGKQVGIPDDRIVAGALPATKVKKVDSLQRQGRVVCMVGDGINDSPALIQANVGIAIGAGTDIALESASIVLVRNCVYDVVAAIQLSRATFSRIKLNFLWALGYNTLMIPVAAGAFYSRWHVLLPPWLASLAMALSSISVVLSSLHLKRWKNRWRVEIDEA